MRVLRTFFAFLILLVDTGASTAGILEDKIPGVWRKTNVAEWRAAPGIGQIVRLELHPVGANGVGRALMVQLNPNGSTGEQDAEYRIYDTGKRVAMDRFELRLSWRRDDGRTDGINFHLRVLSDRELVLEYPSVFMAIVQSREARFARAQ
jgi:hypothetical protein